MNGLTGGRAAGVGVVDDGEVTVAREADIDFDACGAKGEGEADGGEGVFRGAGGGAAMGDDFHRRAAGVIFPSQRNRRG